MTRHDQFTRGIGIMLLGLPLLIGSGCGSSGSGTGGDSKGTCSSSKTCPTADAGPDQTVLVGSHVTVDGSGSSSGTIGLITYQWTLTSQPAGSAATLAGATTVRPTFTPDVAGDYIVKLVVDNGGLPSKPDHVAITAGTGNLPPTADAGPDRTVPPGAIVTLDGSGSHDPNDTLVTYAWTLKKQPPKSQSFLVNPTSATPSFTADVNGKYKLSLTVSDGTFTSSPDQVEITVTDGNIAPVADAGADQTVTTGQLVTLTGAGSADANGDSITYSWRFQTMPDGSTATLANPTSVTPTFTPDFAGFYVLSLVVNDGQMSSSLDMVVIDARLPSFVNAVLQAYVKASNTNAIDKFGTSVALSVDTLAVGANIEDSCAIGINGDQTNNDCSGAGAVYVFTRAAGVWSQQAYVKASNTEGFDLFGTSLALTGDTLVVGAPGESSCATGINGDQTNNDCSGAGAVYVFTRAAGVWSQQAYVKASNTDVGDHLGFSVALSGNTLAAGASDGGGGENSCTTGINGDQTNNDCSGAGAVYVFTRAAGVWSQQAYIKASNTEASDAFGFSVALSGDTLAVGAAFGERSCATGINGDQGNNGCPEAGAAYVFTRAAGVWSQQAYVKASNTGAFEHFGFSVALSDDMLAVGASSENSCATGINGDQANNGCSGAGAVYVFTRTAGVWSQQAYVKASSQLVGDGFGISVALSGNALAVGAAAEDSCATGINGDQINNNCPNAGAVYMFTRTAGVWSQQAYIKASNTGIDGLFGISVALSGDTLAVGAPHEDSCATGINGDQTNNGCLGAGAVYVYVAQ